MTQQREHHRQSLDPFTIEIGCHLEQLEQSVQAYLDEQAWPVAPRWTVASVAAGVWGWRRRHGVASRHRPRGRIHRTAAWAMTILMRRAVAGGACRPTGADHRSGRHSRAVGWRGVR
jgi:hypothetical protein